MFEITRSTLTLFGLTIRWYGVLIALGVLGAVLLSVSREKKLGLPKDTTLNLALIGVPVGIVCARIYYVIFSWDYYALHPGEILAIRAGGMAIYGGLIGGVLVGYVYSHVKKIPFLRLADLVAPSLALAQAVGRWGNFLNQEAYGASVSNPALRFFPISVLIEGSGWHYATFFYESAWCVAIVIALLIADRKNFFKQTGDRFGAYLFLYALERTLVEGLRSDSLYWGPIRVSQLLSLALLMLLTALLAARKGHPLRIVRALPLIAILFMGVSIALHLSVLPVVFALIALGFAAAVYSRVQPSEKV